MENELINGAAKIGIKLSASMVDKFKIYYNELLLWNKRMNLVSRNDEKRIVSRHFLDSLDAVQFIPENACVLDIGSGAGFPGVPIKIVRPDIRLELLEPRIKRFNFLNHLLSTLELDVRIYKNRAENFIGSYNVILSRSVGKLDWLTKVALPILAPGGIIVTYKGSRFWDEFKEITKWKLMHRIPRNFCSGTIVVLRKDEN